MFNSMISPLSSKVINTTAKMIRCVNTILNFSLSAIDERLGLGGCMALCQDVMYVALHPGRGVL